MGGVQAGRGSRLACGRQMSVSRNKPFIVRLVRVSLWTIAVVSLAAGIGLLMLRTRSRSFGDRWSVYWDQQGGADYHCSALHVLSSNGTLRFLYDPKGSASLDSRGARARWKHTSGEYGSAYADRVFSYRRPANFRYGMLYQRRALRHDVWVSYDLMTLVVVSPFASIALTSLFRRPRRVVGFGVYGHDDEQQTSGR